MQFARRIINREVGRSFDASPWSFSTATQLLLRLSPARIVEAVGGMREDDATHMTAVRA